MYSIPPIFKSNCALFSWVKGGFYSDLYMQKEHSDAGSSPLSNYTAKDSEAQGR